MASNIFYGGTADKTLTFSKPVDYLIIYVATGVTFSMSFDNGANYISVAPGSYGFRIGATKAIMVKSSGAWQIIGVQGG